MDRYEHLEKALCRELEKLDKKYTADPGEMSPSDLETADKIYHALKSAATYHAMKDAEESDGEYSGDMRRGRSYRDGARRPGSGRYMGRMDGYSGGYPMDYIDPYWERRGY